MDGKLGEWGRSLTCMLLNVLAETHNPKITVTESWLFRITSAKLNSVSSYIAY